MARPSAVVAHVNEPRPDLFRRRCGGHPVRGGDHGSGRPRPGPCHCRDRPERSGPARASGGTIMLNRAALIVRYKQPYVDWTNAADPAPPRTR